MADLTCDVAVIGAGTAGIAAERNARKHGATTLLIDPHFNGTTCATVGCMPSKVLIASARAAHEARRGEDFGIATGEVTVDGVAVMKRVRALRDRFAGGVRDGFAKLPEGTMVQARARFTGPTTLALDDGREVEAKAIIIATGATPMVPPPYRDLGDALLTNEAIFDLPDLPQSLAVIGAGVVGLELAQAMARLGVRVSVFDMGETLAGARCDRTEAALKAVLERDLHLHMGTKPEPEATEGGVTIRWDDGEAQFDKVLVATGRPPALEGLGLEATGLHLDDHGLPKVDPDTMQCGDAPIFIAGDVNADRPVLHEASDEGSIAGRNAVAYPALIRSDRKTPFSIIFTDPPFVSIGASPDDGAVTGTSDYGNQGRARVDGVNEGIVRLYAAAPDGRLIGADLCCPGADHLGHMLAWAVQGKMTATEILAMPYYHPTLEEGLRSALRDICGSVPIPLAGDQDTVGPPGA
ncbi:dihydrolipoyl dehydrogenase [Maritimibacter sp. DP1N21-5]|uniref:dihydrolipoyl dehydrogenase n=1 Tax=Maritimibacter sp. DP1N21-5 TaxID=2836867 RepID=UPI001C484E15|nr:dihydrolipoyl dehydrogenase [Maritimibacter sp. DP1N21-5]MBV7407960.1 dihydrolipoyl dehydrogenase [Maritimibacter sp. DP1N21-5]